jgi:coatomer subunit alpha
LHNGVVQLWDFRVGTLLDRYEEHEGPVRGIDFHKSQPLFCSGGDDYKIKVWNFKARRCLFTLLGHLDYIRTVQFHPENPWIVSASDDQTIRLWNWQNRTCISVLTGHNHYVMCAQFHPREDLIVSASLDQTVRVWDTSGLRRKNARGSSADEAHLGRGGAGSQGGSSDIFGATDAMVKYVLEGHERGVNWAAFHPTQNLIASGADDRQVKLWRMNDSKAWEMDTLRGHNNNVSCVLFHAKHDLVISNSEDRSIRVWDIQRRTCVQTFRREADRFWMLCVHPEQNLIAAGHDSGMVVFKLERERPAYASVDGQLFYVRDRDMRRAVLGTGSDVHLVALRPRNSGVAGSSLGSAPRTLTFNPFNPSEDNILITSTVDGGIFELFVLSTNTTGGQSSGRNASSFQQQVSVEGGAPVRGACISAVFTARGKIAVLDKSRQITTRGFTSNDPGKRIKPPYSNADMLFPSMTPGRVLVRSPEDRICLFELQSRRTVAELSGISVKYVVWSTDGSMVALLAKHAVILADKELTQICSVTETVRVKSGAWDEHGVFIYTTLNHVKYLLPTAGVGESGIVRTLDAPVYAVECRAGNLYVLDREAKVKALVIDPTEHLFKLALSRRQFDRVLNIIKQARLCGQAVIAFLQRAGYPEIALLFVEDEQTRFDLSVQCQNLDVAFKAAKAIGSEACWHRLASEALRQGNLEMAELCFQNTKAFEKLSFLYTVTGNTEKLNKMLLVAQVRNDAQSRFHNALCLGNATERVKVLEGAGQTSLAYLTAATHGLVSDAERIKGYLVEAGLSVPILPTNAKALAPLAPLRTLVGSVVVPENLKTPASAASAKDGGRQQLDLAAIAAAAAAMSTDDALGLSNASGLVSGTRTAAVAAVAVAQAQAQVAAKYEAERRIESAAAAAARAAAGLDDENDEGDNAGQEGSGSGWGDDDLGLEGSSDTKKGGWGDDDLDLGDEDITATVQAPKSAQAPTGPSSTAATELLTPNGGSSVPSLWVANSSLAGDHAAAGSFETAMQLLNRQIGIVNFAPLKGAFLQAYTGARCAIPTLPHLSPYTLHASRNDASSSPPKEMSLPFSAISLSLLEQRLQHVYQTFTDGKFTECRDTCDELFALLPLCVVTSKEEVLHVKAVLKACCEYKLAVRVMQTARTSDQEDKARQMELAAYMTHCLLEPPHLLLALNSAMRTCYKHQNFIAAAGFARRLLELPEANSAKNAKLLNDVSKFFWKEFIFLVRFFFNKFRLTLFFLILFSYSFFSPSPLS